MSDKLWKKKRTVVGEVADGDDGNRSEEESD